jgi:hypothetical protein
VTNITPDLSSFSAAMADALLQAQAEGVALNVARWFRLIGHVAGQWVEVQALKVPDDNGRWPKSYAAHVDSSETFLHVLEAHESNGSSPAVYTIFNQIDPAVATRAAPTAYWHEILKDCGTSDREITRRKALYVDIDYGRVKGTSATDAQVALTHEVGVNVYWLLGSIVGFDTMAFGHSGNGRAVFAALDHLPETPHLKGLVCGILCTLKALFETDKIIIDTSVSDAKRLCPAFGTMKRKGAPGIAEYPHRRTAIMVPPVVRRLTLAELEGLLATLRARLTTAQLAEVDKAMGVKGGRPKAAGASSGRAGRADDPYRKANDLDIADVLEWLGLLTEDDSPICPSCGRFDGSTVAIVGNGVKCLHGSCAEKGLKGFFTPLDCVIETKKVEVKEAYFLMRDQWNLDPALAALLEVARVRGAAKGGAAPVASGVSPPDGGKPTFAPPAASQRGQPPGIAEILALVEAAPSNERTQVAISPVVVDYAATLREKDATWIQLKVALQALGVRVRDWVAAVRAVRRTSGSAVEAAEELRDDELEGEGGAKITIVRQVIMVSPDEHIVNDEAASALSALPTLYSRAYHLVDVLREPQTGALQIRDLNQSLVRDALSRTCRFVVEGEANGMPALIPVHPPEWCPPNVHARGKWPGVRSLRAVVPHPVVLPSGQVHDTPGYDAATSLIYAPNVTPISIPTVVTAEHVREALDEIFYMWKDVPFLDATEGWHIDETWDETYARMIKSEHVAACVAGLLTPFARHAYVGPAPLFLINANVRGTGKDLVKQCIEQIVLGREMQFMVQSTERDAEAEDRKKITALAAKGATLVNIDNIRKALGNGTLEGALTSTTWGERILGKSETPEYPLLMTWYANGNNVTLAGDMPRRALDIMLVSPYAKPEDRKDFSEADLIGYVKEHRPELVWACLVLLRAWTMTADHTDALKDPGPTGSYGGWSRIVRGAVVHAGLRDPWARRGSAEGADADDDGPQHELLVNGWQEALQTLGKAEATADDVLTSMKANDEACEIAARRVWMPTPAAQFKLLRAAIAQLIPGLRAGELPNAMQLGARLKAWNRRPTVDRRSIRFHKTSTLRLYGIDVGTTAAGPDDPTTSPSTPKSA